MWDGPERDQTSVWVGVAAIRSKTWALAVAFFLAVSIAPAAGAPADPTAKARRPNILIIVTDDQHGGMRVLPEVTSFFGDGGTRFTRGFANTPLCCPARATLMSGQYPHNHGVKSNMDWKNLDMSDTLQNDLRAAGYKTAIFGKYLNHFPVDAMEPPDFDRFAVFRTGGSDGNQTGYYRGGIWNINGTVKTVDRYTSHVLEDRSVRFIRANADQPWLMYLTVPAPHGPLIAERRYKDARVGSWDGNPAVAEADRTDKPPWIYRHSVGVERGRRIRRKQFRTLMSVNDMVGRVTKALRATGQARDTLAFFTTDNGFLWGEHGVAGKPTPYLPSIEVPFYARWPGRLPAGETADRLVSHIDITATAYEAAGVTPGHELDGYSLVGDHRRERLLTEMLVEAKGIPIWSSVLTDAGEHYIQYRSGAGVLFRELYDLETDPWELQNLAPLDVDRWTALEAVLESDSTCSGETCP